MSEKLHIRDVDVRGRRVLTRVDFNVPLTETGAVGDDTRIRMALPTIRHLVSSGGRVVLMSHLGRPKGKVVDAMRLAPAAARLSELLGRNAAVAADCIGPEAESAANALGDGDIVLLENLRFHDAETKNDEAFSRSLARLGDLYVNDAFGTAHRAHASTVGVTAFFEQRAMGFLMEREISGLSRATERPEHPYVAILGGAKVSDKIGVVENLLSKVDVFLIGGAMAYTFLKAQGKDVGDSLVEPDKTDVALRLLDAARSAGKAFLLPEDVLAADAAAAGARTKVAASEAIGAGWRGVDIGPATAGRFAAEVGRARTIVWNGPLGIFEIPEFASGTNAVAVAVAEATRAGAASIVGGGDTAAAISKAGLADAMTHVSTGGGASLEFLEGKVLPGIAALSDARPSR
ncbi:MAG: phosphoglycerate kinase [Candidatus Eisenbacteria bacterium]|nr:phosphoglycerate kinase [Candidatus Eisenbacteria bacterium]